MKIALKHPIIFSIILFGLCFICLEVITRVYYLYNYGYKSKAKDAVYSNQKDAKNIFKDSAKRKFEAYPYVMHRTKPNQHFRTFNINSLGFRGKEIEKTKKEGYFRIVILGGSAVWGTGASNDEATISGSLERKLNDVYNTKRFEVINAGDSAYISTQELILLFDRIIELDPDLVITFDGYNDAYAGFINNVAGFPENFLQFKEKLESHNVFSFLGLAVRELLSHSMFLETIKQRLRVFISRKTISLDNNEIPTTYVNAADIARVYGRNLEYMYAILKDRRIKSLFTIQPILAFGSKHLTDTEKSILAVSNIDIIGYSQYMKKVYSSLLQELKRVHSKCGAKVLDLTGVFDNINGHVFIDDVHFSDEANDIIVQKIFEAIIKEGLLQRDYAQNFKLS